MTLDNMIEAMIEDGNLKEDKIRLEATYNKVYERLSSIQEEGNSLFIQAPQYVLYLLNLHLPDEDKINMDIIDGKTKFVLLNNPKTYIDTPFNEEDKLERLKLLLKLDFRVGLGAALVRTLGTTKLDTNLTIDCYNETSKDYEEERKSYIKKMN